MPAAPLPLTEAERLAALRAYDVLDSAGERSFDDIVAIARTVCDTPMAAVTLIDAERQWFLARHGLPDPETPRDQAFCAHTILDDAALVVQDTLKDPRFADNPDVTGGLGVRFYAGAPLIAPGGYGIGSLCVIGRQARAIAPSQVAVLEALARQVVLLLEHRRTARALAVALERTRLLAALVPICAWCRKVRDDRDYWMEVDRYLQTNIGAEVTHGICPDCAAAHFPEADGGGNPSG